MEQALRGVDDALVRLRRLWDTNQRQAVDASEQLVEMSSILVVEACARGAEAGREVTIGGVAEFADVEHSTASRLVDRAVAAGLVARAPSTADARRTSLTLTDDGRVLCRRSRDFRMGWLAHVLRDWPDEDVTQFARLLDRFAHAVVEHGPPGRPPRSAG